MNTTLKQMTLPTPKGDEVLDMTEFATNESVVNGLASVESKVEAEADSIEAKIDESVNTLSTKIDNIDLSAVENKVQEESAVIQSKIDNIKLPEIDTTELAKQGENQEATMSAVLEEVMKLNGSFAEQIHNIVGE